MRMGAGAYADEAGARKALDKVCMHKMLCSLPDRLYSSQVAKQTRTTVSLQGVLADPKRSNQQTTRVRNCDKEDLPDNDHLPRRHQRHFIECRRRRFLSPAVFRC